MNTTIELICQADPLDLLKFSIFRGNQIVSVMISINGNEESVTLSLEELKEAVSKL